MPESPDILNVWKERGETLAVLLRRIRKERDIPPAIPITYAGRLDPMAEGVVILLCGDARFKKEQYMKLDKSYEFQVLFGVSTDTYDVLGIITEVKIGKMEDISGKIEATMEKIKNERLSYPPFSSKTVNGKPLFVYAREGEVSPEIPLQPATPTDIRFLEEREVHLSSLIDTIITDVAVVEGDFRQEEIIKGWETIQKEYGDQRATLLVFETTVPSGVYIRSIAQEIGRAMGIPALAYQIVRKKIKGMA